MWGEAAIFSDFPLDPCPVYALNHSLFPWLMNSGLGQELIKNKDSKEPSVFTPGS